MLRLLSRILIVSFLSGISLFAVVLQPVFNGEAALEYTRKATAFGERPAGSEALKKCRDWVVSQLKPLGGQLALDNFVGQTPSGPIPMTNIILKFPGTSGKAIAVTGHYDTKRIAMVHFVGANDGGSSTGWLIEFAKVMAHAKHADDIYVVFFDGEEATGEWTDTDSRYGSRQLALKWAADGTLAKIRALINIDMVGDKDLDVTNDSNSSESLRKTVFAVAGRLGDAKYFRTNVGSVDDDHMPFVNAGVNSIDLLDLDYGPNGGYWHTAADTMDKLSAHSLQVVGDVVLGVIGELEQSK